MGTAHPRVFHFFRFFDKGGFSKKNTKHKKMATACIQSVARPGDGSGVVQPSGVAVCADGSYVLTDSQRIIRVHPQQTRNQKVGQTLTYPPRLGKEARACPDEAATQWLVAGASGTPGCTDGIGHAARFSSPFGLAIAADGAGIVVADTKNHKIRVIQDFSHSSADGCLPSAYGGSSPTETGSYWGGSGASRSTVGGGGVDQQGQHPVPKVTTLAGADGQSVEHDDHVLHEGREEDEEQGEARYADGSYDEDSYDEYEYHDGDSYGSDSVFVSPNTSVDTIDLESMGAAAAPDQLCRTHDASQGSAFHARIIVTDHFDGVEDRSSDDELPPDPIDAASASSCSVAPASAAAEDGQPQSRSTTPTPQTSCSPIPSRELLSFLAAGGGAASAGTGQTRGSPSPTSLAAERAASKFKGRAALFPAAGDTAAPPSTAGQGHCNDGTAHPRKHPEVLRLPDGHADYAEFNGPLGVAVHPDGTVVVTESWRHAVRSVKDGVVRTLAGSHDTSGCVDGTNGDAARFFGLLGIAVLPNGDCVVADRDNCRVRTISAAGKVTTLAGSGQQGSDDGATCLDATFSIPSSVAADVAGRVVVADNATNWSSAALRIIDPHTNTVRTLTLASAESGNTAVLTVDTKIAVDAHGNIVCANSGGIHLVTNTGLAPGFSAWWRPVFWKKPRRKLGRLLGSASACSSGARAALKAVFLIKGRLDSGSFDTNADGDSVREQQRAPPLPDKLWHHILGMLQPWQLGGKWN